MTAPIIKGAEPESIDGGPHGALVLHGFTGNPGSMKGVAHALADAGFAVELPLLPGHGTVVEDMLDTTWADWSREAEAALERLQARVTGEVVVVGLSMGGSLTAWLGTRHPELAGLVFINAAVSIPEGMRELVEAAIANGDDLMDGIGSDIADPDSQELAYKQTPLRPLLSLFDAEEETRPKLPNITCPSLIITSRQDHVVPPENSDVLAAEVGGPVERVWLDRSYHVATQDYDKEEIFTKTVEFARRVTAPHS
jgi:carboxylesterase